MAPESSELAAWSVKFAGREESLEAAWELAELQERRGDALFFREEKGAAEHFHAALKALIPQGSMFTSREENDRRMEAHGRVMEKIRAIDPYGKPRSGHTCLPHPNSGLTPERIEELRRERIAREEREAEERREAEARKKAIEERREATLWLREKTRREKTEFAKLFRGAGHWGDYSLGQKWREAGKALAASYPAAATLAFTWSVHYFEEYNEAWTAGLPASRWDSDGGSEIMEVREMDAALPSDVREKPPEWVQWLLAGAWSEALAALGEAPPEAEFKVLALLLADACYAAGRKEEGAWLRAAYLICSPRPS
jgi:hypothetical protein